MAKFVTVEEAVALIPDGATIMCGGFMGCGNAHKIIDALSKSGKGNFTLISNDGSMPGGPLGEDYYGVAKLIHNHQVKHLIATHVGLNPEVAQQMNDGSMKVDLIPQGSLAEMIRADGAGLGGVLTPTGVGTIVEDNKDFCLGKQTIPRRRGHHLRQQDRQGRQRVVQGHHPQLQPAHGHRRRSGHRRGRQCGGDR